jgi:ribosome-binding factor A
MRIRTLPSLEFARDTSYEYGDRLERLFDRMYCDGTMTTEDPESEGEG